jgi:hypothetical protein
MAAASTRLFIGFLAVFLSQLIYLSDPGAGIYASGRANAAPELDPGAAPPTGAER